MATDSKTSVFDPEAMAIRYEIGAAQLKLMPLKNKALRELIRVVEEALAGVSAAGKTPATATLSGTMDVVMLHAHKILRVLFPGPNHDFITPEFIEENMTYPMIRKIFQDAVRLNQLEDIFPALKGIGAPPSKTSGA